MTTLTEGLQELPLSQIIPTPDNNRRIDPDSQAIQDLATSIGEMGVIQPVVVRPHPTEKDMFDLRAGARRFYASKKANQETIPAVVRQLTDEQAMEVTVVENMQREDLAPLEEATGVQKLLDTGHVVEEIAAAIGRTETWVYMRAQLMRLTDGWKSDIRHPYDEETHSDYGSQINTWSAAHLELVARLPEETQERLLKRYTEAVYHRPSLKDLRGEIANLTRQLGKAGFDLTDGSLTKGAPACTDCGQRAGMKPDLFGLQEETPIKKDTCLHGPCYEKKMQAHARRLLRTEREKAPETIEVKKQRGWYGSTNNEYNSKGATFQKCKKNEEGAVPAVVTSKEGLGQKVFVKKTKDAKEESTPKTVRELRKELKEQRQKAIVEGVCTQMTETTWEPLKKAGKDEWALLRLFCALQADPEISLEESLQTWEKARPEDIVGQLWYEMKPSLIQALQVYWGDSAGKVVKDAQVLADWVGWDWQEFVDEAEKAHPEPAEWKGVKAGDVPPAAKKKGKGKKEAA